MLSTHTPSEGIRHCSWCYTQSSRSLDCWEKVLLCLCVFCCNSQICQSHWKAAPEGISYNFDKKAREVKSLQSVPQGSDRIFQVCQTFTRTVGSSTCKSELAPMDDEGLQKMPASSRASREIFVADVIVQYVAQKYFTLPQKRYLHKSHGIKKQRFGLRLILPIWNMGCNTNCLPSKKSESS